MIQKGYILADIKRAMPPQSYFADFCQLKLQFSVKAAAVFSDRTAERLTDELYIFSFFVYGVTIIAFLQRLCRNGILDIFQKRGLWFGL